MILHVMMSQEKLRNISLREEVEKRVQDRGFVLHNSTYSDFDATELVHNKL